ncbi:MULTISPECIES: encapsulin [Streptomyces]|uniref:encapsulin n=1 Tax=[Kitasatospora] papulosa TaxID=1464011 RepID=UPI0023AEF483|nr:family 1 encapsulin nanocompartment shell protein [Streptomyces sp. KA12]MDF0376291.1 encapsulin [Streptomyces sp. KA12]
MSDAVREAVVVRPVVARLTGAAVVLAETVEPGGAEVTGISDHGCPVATHLARQLDEPILWAPAVQGGVPLSTRGGDVELCLGQDPSIGYLDHDATSTRLHFHQAFTFRMPTPEAVVSLIA